MESGLNERMIEDADRPICDYEGSTYRTDFWEGQGRQYEDRVERVALRRLLPPSGDWILDIGAGFGRLASMYDGYRRVILFDYSKSQLEYARRRLGDERFVYVAGDLYRLPLASGLVDTAVMVRVLHHIADVPAAFVHIARVVRPGGDFVLEFANKRHLKNRVRHLLGRGPDPNDPTPYEFAELHYDFHPDWVLLRLREAGFRDGRRLAVSHFRARPLKRVVPTAWLTAMDGALQQPLASLALAPSMFVRSNLPRPSDGAPPAPQDPARIFRCPTCGREPLGMDEDGVTCDACDAHWPRENGVFVFK